jgi:carbon-monoxide dehydrogenase small subunit
MKQILKIRVNGDDHELYVDPRRSLAEVLRNELGLLGVKEGCLTGYCGVCTVLINGQAVKSCLVFAHQVQDKDVLTIEGLAQDGQLHPIQQAFIDHFAFQCGFCTPGMILSLKALLDKNPNPSEEDIRMALIGNLCRCTGYHKIVEAGLALAKSNN